MRNLITTIEIEGAYTPTFDHILYHAVVMYLEGDEESTIQEYAERQLLELHDERFWDSQDNQVYFLNMVTHFMNVYNKTIENARDVRNDLQGLYIPYSISPLNVNDKRYLLRANFGVRHNE